jgi:hypothetical protein
MLAGRNYHCLIGAEIGALANCTNECHGVGDPADPAIVVRDAGDIMAGGRHVGRHVGRSP